MNYQSDIIIGLQNLKEGKTHVFCKIIKENYYDLCIKVNGGTENSLIKFKDDYIHLKEVPYSILFGIDTYISDSCIINLEDFKKDIEILIKLNISLTKLFISNNAIFLSNKNILDNLKLGINNNKFTINDCLVDKIYNQALKIKDLDDIEYYYFLYNNSITRVDSYDFIKKYNKVLAYQFLSFNNDIDCGNNLIKSGLNCHASFCFNILNFKTISNIYGVSCVYEIFEDIDKHNKELDKIKELEFRNFYFDWLNLDKLIKNININNIKILLFTKINILNLLTEFKIFYENNLVKFNCIHLFKIFIKEKINLNCNLSIIEFLVN